MKRKKIIINFKFDIWLFNVWLQLYNNKKSIDWVGGYEKKISSFEFGVLVKDFCFVCRDVGDWRQ